MTTHHASRSARPLIFAGLAASLLFGCARENAYSPGIEPPPPNQAAAHKPTYLIQATIEDGEMASKTGSGTEIAAGEPPLEVPPLHAWAEPTMDSAPTSIEIDASLAKACSVPDAKAFFASDGSDLQPEAMSALDALAARVGGIDGVFGPRRFAARPQFT